MLPNPQPYFADRPDLRRETKNKLHKLQDIVMIVLCAVLSGIEDGVGLEGFAEEREHWFRRVLELPNGIPSHDTLSEVMGRLKPVAFRQAFLAGVEEATRESAGRRSVERRYFLGSFADLDRFADGVRAHWSSENSQHWVLDVHFGEDRNRTGRTLPQRS